MQELVDRKVEMILAANVAATVGLQSDDIVHGGARGFRPRRHRRGEQPRTPGHQRDRHDDVCAAADRRAPSCAASSAAVPDLDKISIVLNGNNRNNAAQFKLLQARRGCLAFRCQALDVRKPEDVERAFDEAVASGAKALTNAVDTFINSRRFALRRRRGETQAALRLFGYRIRPGGRIDGARPGPLRGVLRRGQVRRQNLARHDPRTWPSPGPTEFTMSANRGAFKQLDRLAGRSRREGEQSID